MLVCGFYRLGHAMLGEDNVPLLLLCSLLFIELLVFYIKMEKKREKVEVRSFPYQGEIFKILTIVEMSQST